MKQRTVATIIKSNVHLVCYRVQEDDEIVNAASNATNRHQKAIYLPASILAGP